MGSGVCDGEEVASGKWGEGGGVRRPEGLLMSRCVERCGLRLDWSIMGVRWRTSLCKELPRDQRLVKRYATAACNNAFLFKLGMQR